MFDLKGRAAIVTGGARGIGRGIALELAHAGAAVAIADLDPGQAEPVVRKIQALRAKAIALQLDVMDARSVERCVQNAIDHFGCIDILVNNAGIFQSRIGFEQTAEDFNRCLDVNLTGIWRIVQALAPHFKAQRAGKIVNIASTGGRQGVDFAAGYCASKAGVISLTQSLALALGADNINVNTVCPGAVPTAMQDSIKLLTTQRHVGNDRTFPVQPLAGPLTEADIGRAVVFFASDYARNITGQALNVDCGLLMN